MDAAWRGQPPTTGASNCDSRARLNLFCLAPTGIFKDWNLNDVFAQAMCSPLRRSPYPSLVSDRSLFYSFTSPARLPKVPESEIPTLGPQSDICEQHQ